MSRVFSSIVFASLLSSVLAAPMMASQSYNSGSSNSGSGYSGSSNSGSKYSSSSNSGSGYSGGSNSGSGYGGGSSSGSGYSGGSSSGSGYSGGSSSGYSSNSGSAMASESTYAPSSGSVMYGSSSSTWGGQGYNNCVQQCMATYPMASSSYTPPSSYTSNDSSSNSYSSSDSYSSNSNSTDAPTGTSTAASTTHTVIVAPTKGVLRYVPAFVNASVGDTVRFIWGAGPHTVTQSSILTPCNKSAEPGAFASGLQNASFVFDQVINNTDTTFFYCGVPTHCEKGMFGIINPPSAPAESSTMTVGSWVMSQAASNPSMAALYTYVQNQTMNTSANGWGMNVDMSTMPASSYMDVAQNAMYSAMFYAANAGMLEKGQGASAVSSSGITIPADISSIMANLAVTPPDNSVSSSASGTSDSGPYGAAPAASSAPAASGSLTGQAAGSVANGSGRLASSTAVVGLVAMVASFLAL